MRYKKIIGALAVLCLLAGSAFAVAKLAPAVVDEGRCTGCGSCVDECPAGAITLGDNEIAVVDKEKCTGCMKCIKSCPFEATSIE